MLLLSYADTMSFYSELSGPKISIILPLGSPPIPIARSRPKDPVDTAATSTFRNITKTHHRIYLQILILYPLIHCSMFFFYLFSLSVVDKHVCPFSAIVGPQCRIQNQGKSFKMKTNNEY